MTKADIFEFMAPQRLGVLGTLSPAGRPQAALVGIAVTPELEIIFDTVKTSRKFLNLVSDPGCSFVVGWDGETTVQCEGQAYQPQGDALAYFQRVYFANWADGPSRLSWLGITHFVVRPTWLRYSDFDLDPPSIKEFTVETCPHQRDIGTVASQPDAYASFLAGASLIQPT